MTYTALGFSLFIAAMGALGVASPARLFSILRTLQTPAGLYGSGAIRVLLGVVLLLVAPTSKAPDFLRIFGVIAVAAGIATPLVGLERVGKVMEWWIAKPGPVLRAWAAFPLALGLYLAWAVVQ
jgi:hypothetical protein